MDNVMSKNQIEKLEMIAEEMAESLKRLNDVIAKEKEANIEID